MRSGVYFLICIFLASVFPVSSYCDGTGKSERGLFVTVIEKPAVLSSRKEITKLVYFARKAHIKTLFVQIYQSNRAWFPSKLADDAPYKACLKSISEDPFRLLIKEAHRSGIRVHAWVNMLSLCDNKGAFFLKKYGADILTRNLNVKRTLSDYKIDDQYFLEPGDLRVRRILAGIVEEIVRAYPELDGIQFDYIRYPDMKPHYGYTKVNVERFKKTTGLKTVEDQGLTWKEWKRRQVTELVELLAGKARTLRPGIAVSATGCMPYSRAYLEAFQDWPSWLDRGIVDFVTIMNYSPSVPEFESWISGARVKTRHFDRVNIGVGAYKLVRSPAIFKEEFRFCEKAGAGACVIFHYGSLLENPVLYDFLINVTG